MDFNVVHYDTLKSIKKKHPVKECFISVIKKDINFFSPFLWSLGVYRLVYGYV